MTDDEYLAAQQALLLAAQLLALHDWAAFRARIDRAETMGVFLMAPFAYQTAAPRTSVLHEMAGDARKMIAGLEKLKGLVGETPHG